jgi:hypothetical protein
MEFWGTATGDQNGEEKAGQLVEVEEEELMEVTGRLIGCKINESIF